MKHLFLPYKLSLLAKQKGFDLTCLSAYRNSDGEEQLLPTDKWKNSDAAISSSPDSCAAPVYQQIVDWLRIEHKILVHQVLGFHNKHYCFKIQTWAENPLRNIDTAQEGDYYKTFNKAIEIALNHVNQPIPTIHDKHL